MKIFKRKFKKKYGKICYTFCQIPIFSYKPKLGVSYNLFDGEELLESSIRSIRKEVDYINVVCQRISNFGQEISEDVEPLLKRLQECGLIDEVFWYEPILSNPHDNECAKRTLGLKMAKRAGCSHFMGMDVDEYYKAEELAKAKEFVFQKNLGASAVCIIEYLKSPHYQLVNGYAYNLNQEFYVFHVPFIMKIHKFRKQEYKNSDFPCFVDPTRKLNSDERFYLFPSQEIAMHHMSTVRVNLLQKYKNTSLMNSSQEIQMYVKNLRQQILDFDFETNRRFLQAYSMFHQSFVRKVENVFNVPSEALG